MGRSVSIDFEFVECVDIMAVLDGLSQAGWDYVLDSKIGYMVDDYDWRFAAETALASVLDEMAKTVADGEATAINLQWSTEATGGYLLFHPGLKSLSFMPVHETKYLSSGASKFADSGWYVARLVPSFEKLGLVGIHAHDEYP